MFDIGWTELLVIGVVALIVIGPQDLPDMFRQIGRFTGKMRAMARDFQRAMDDAAKSSGVADVAKDLRNATSAKGLGLTAVKEAADKFEKWDPLKPAKPAVKPPVTPVVTKPAIPAAPIAATAEELADMDELESAFSSPVPVADGPHTQALRDKQAEKRQIVAEARAKLKALEDGTARVNVYTAQIEPAPLGPPAPKAAPPKAASSAAETTPAVIAVPAAKPEKPAKAPKAAKPGKAAPAPDTATAAKTSPKAKPAPKAKAPPKAKVDEA